MGRDFKLDHVEVMGIPLSDFRLKEPTVQKAGEGSDVAFEMDELQVGQTSVTVEELTSDEKMDPDAFWNWVRACKDGYTDEDQEPVMKMSGGGQMVEMEGGFVVTPARTMKDGTVQMDIYLDGVVPWYDFPCQQCGYHELFRSPFVGAADSVQCPECRLMSFFFKRGTPVEVTRGLGLSIPGGCQRIQ